MKSTKPLLDYLVLPFVFGLLAFVCLAMAGALGGTHRGELVRTNALTPLQMMSEADVAPVAVGGGESGVTTIVGGVLGTGEPMYLCSANPTIWQPLPVLLGHSIGTNVAKMTLKWVLTTNWVTENYGSRTLMNWIGPNDPNITTWYESGMVQSNLVAFIEWKGAVHGVTIETIAVARLSRSYTEKPVREYSPIEVTPVVSWSWTNALPVWIGYVTNFVK